MRRLMESAPTLNIVAVTTPAPERFRSRSDFKAVEFIQKDDFEFIERLEQLRQGRDFHLSREVLEKHLNSEYSYLSISDRRALPGVPVYKRRGAFRRLLAYWYDFLSRRSIDAVIVIGYPHAGWNNVLIDVAQALSIKIVLMDFTVISDTTLVGDINRLHEQVTAERYAHLPTEKLREAVPAALLSRVAAPLFGLAFSHQVKREVQEETAATSYFSLLKGLLRNPRRRLRPSFTRLSGDVTQLWMAAYTLKSKRHVADLARLYGSIATAQPDLERPFVYFPLHMQPERSTTPAGGVFEDQLLVAEILSASLPKGWSLYIKEHPSQFWQARAVKQAWFRDRGYYERLKALPNTQLVSLDYDSRDLIGKAATVATVTGTAGWEAILAGKACLAFGEPWYLGCRACFTPSSVAECSAALDMASTMGSAEVERALLEFLLHYADRIIPIAFLPDRTQLSAEDYAAATAVLAGAVRHALKPTSEHPAGPGTGSGVAGSFASDEAGPAPHSQLPALERNS